MGSCLSARVIFIIFLFHYCTAVPAQKNGTVFNHLTTKNGLSCNRSNAVIQDSRGFYWIATDDGLNRFDGSTCKIFRNIKNDSTSLSMNYCNLILEDEQGDIWVGTHMGVNRYIYGEDRFERHFLHHPDIGIDRVNMISGLQKDGEGNIWVSSQGIWRYNRQSGKWKVFHHVPGDLSSIPPGIVTNLRYDKVKKGLWMNVEGIFVFFDINEGRFYHTGYNPYSIAFLDIKTRWSPFVLDSDSQLWFVNDQSQLSSYGISNNEIHHSSYKISKGFFALTADPENRIWIHYWFGGTIIFDPRTQKIDSSFLSVSHPQSALSNQAFNLYTDKTGIYWIMSRNGISIHDPAEQAVQYFLLPGNRKTMEGAGNSIYCMLEQDEDILWLGTNTGLCRFDMAKNDYHYFDHLPFSGAIIKCLYLQNKTQLWVGTQTGLYTYDIRSGKIAKKNPSRIHTQFITTDKDENIWVGTWHNGLLLFSAAGEFIKSYTRDAESSKTILHNNLIGFRKDSSGSNLWIGYNGGYGFCRLDAREKIFMHFKIKTQEPHFNAINTINCFAEDPAGNLWIGANGGGLFFFNRKENSFKTYTQSDGLKSNYINAVLRDEAAHLWISTSNGLSILNILTDEIINTAIDLERSNDFLPTGLQRKNGKMLFFAGKKLVEVDPVGFLKKTYPARVLFSSFKIFDKEYPLSGSEYEFSTTLSHNENFFSIEYSLLTSDPNSINQYAYQMKGFDKGWVNVRERRIANYTNIPPGKYSFQVKATDASGKDFLSKIILISIRPPFWITWWFLSLAGIVLMAGLLFIYNYRVAQVKKMYSLRTNISQDLHDEVASTLSGIRLYSEMAKDQLDQYDSVKVRRTLEVISSNASDMTQNMSDIVWTINPGNDSFSKLLEKLRTYATERTAAHQMQFFYDQKSNLPEQHLNMQQRRDLYLICKEAIHNAVKYSEAKRVTMKVFCADRRLHIHIQDDGKGFDAVKIHEGNGLLNMQKRCGEIGAVLAIISKKNEGTRIEIDCNLGKW